MRRSILPVIAVAAVTACAPIAQGAADPPPAGALTVSAQPSSTIPLPSASPAASAPHPDPTLDPPVTRTPSPTPPALPPAAPTAPGTTVDPRVIGGPAPVGSFVLGDSISLSPGIGPVLGRYGYPVVGLVGQSVSDAYLTTHLSTSTAQFAPAWVIELGTNNAGDAADIGRLEHWVDLIDGLRTPGAKQTVLWVTPYRPAAGESAAGASALDAFTAELGRLAGQHRWLRLLDFASLAKANQQWFTQDAALRLHPDAAGQAALVRLVAGRDPVPAATPVAPSDAATEPNDEPVEPDPEFDNTGT